jgi:hypothetical protein
MLDSVQRRHTNSCLIEKTRSCSTKSCRSLRAFPEPQPFPPQADTTVSFLPYSITGSFLSPQKILQHARPPTRHYKNRQKSSWHPPFVVKEMILHHLLLLVAAAVAVHYFPVRDVERVIHGRRRFAVSVYANSMRSSWVERDNH